VDDLRVEVDVRPLETVELGAGLAAVEGDRVRQRVVGVERGDQLRGLCGSAIRSRFCSSPGGSVADRVRALASRR
jgi:hypothetical protein